MKNTIEKATKTNKVTTEKQTPIEIALRIDENGMTTASNLYEFLGLDITHYSRWCKKNIVDNKFAIEGEDYVVLPISSKKHTLGGRPKIDYKLTSEFVKQLSMTAKNERGQEARKYFVDCEQSLKIANEKLENLTDTLSAISQSIGEMNNRLSKLDESQNRTILQPKKYSYWKTKTFEKLKLLLSYANEHSDETIKLYGVIHAVINETENTYGIDVNDYMDDYKYEFGLYENPYVIDVIDYYKDVKDMFTTTLNNILDRFNITYSKCKISKNIFDRLEEQIESCKEGVDGNE